MSERRRFHPIWLFAAILAVIVFTVVAVRRVREHEPQPVQPAPGAEARE